MLPTLAILAVLVIEVLIFGNDLSIEKIFSIVSIISNFYGPLTNLVTIMDTSYEYGYAIRSLNNYLFFLDNRPKRKVETAGLGTITMSNCTMEKVDEIEMFEKIQSIFGKHLKTLGEPTHLKQFNSSQNSTSK